MFVPFVDLKMQYATLKTQMVPALESLMASSQFILGKPVDDFERSFAAAHDMNYCVGVGSGTEALHIILWAYGIGPGDEVITAANTFIATAEAISLTGATPVFVDVDPSSYTMDPRELQRAISARTKAVIPVHLYGQTAQMKEIVEIAGQHNILLVEDACQAHLAMYDGQYVGHFGVAAGFSFYPGKNLGAYGEAGGVTTNDEVLAAKLRMLRDHGQVKKYHHATWGLNYRLDAMQAAVLNVKMPHVKSWTEARRAHARRYDDLLRGIGDIVTPAERPGGTHVYHLYVIQTTRRDELQKYLSAHDIQTGLHYPVPLHLQEAYQSLGWKKGDFPVSERLAERGLSLPMFAELTDDQIDHVCGTIKNFF